MRTRLLLFGIVCGAAFFLSAGVGAVDFPTKEIRLVVPYKAGGQSDLAARKIAEINQKQNILPETMLVINMSGANTLEGLRAVRDASPDGYTLLFHHSALLTMEAMGTLTLDWRSAFDPVCQVMEIPFVFSVKTNRDDGKSWKTLTEFAADAKANPGKYVVSIQGTGGSAHFSGMQVLMALGIDKDVKYMPLSGGNDSVTALMAGRVDIRPAPSSDVARFVQSGDEKVLAFINATPSDNFPGAELVTDLGIDNAIKMRTGVWAPKNLPEDVREILNDAFARIVATAEFQEFMESQSADAAYLPGPAWLEVFEADSKSIMEIGKELKR
ncbi:MAG: tripartite tricarboxylate transporter substrate binding protein [Planctomycetes bacterium]|nr:tripartite tricarboxylate transporter substrate binding protein [Planctomycetota bacterium]